MLLKFLRQFNTPFNENLAGIIEETSSTTKVQSGRANESHDNNLNCLQETVIYRQDKIKKLLKYKIIETDKCALVAVSNVSAHNMPWSTYRTFGARLTARCRTYNG